MVVLGGERFLISEAPLYTLAMHALSWNHSSIESSLQVGSTHVQRRLNRGCRGEMRKKFRGGKDREKRFERALEPSASSSHNSRA